jgi:O-antigen/teichoic acid export membrane protein
MNPFSRIFRLSAAFLGSNLARAAIGFGLSLVLARGLGAERFGRWVLCTTCASTLTIIADLGFGVLLTRDGARLGTDALEAWREVLSALWLRLIVAVPIGAGLFVAATHLGAADETVTGMRVAALLGVFGAAYGCFGAMFRSQQRWLPTVLAMETAWLGAQLGCAWWLVGRGGGVASLMALAAAVQAAQLASAAILWRPIFGAYCSVRPSYRGLTQLIRRALPFAAAGFVANLESRIGPLMLGYLATPSAVGLFAAAARFGRVTRLVPQAVFAGALPVLSHDYSRDREEAGRVFRTFSRLILLFATLSAVGCVLWAAPLLGLVYGSEFSTAAPVLVWIGIGLIPTLSNSAQKIFLYAAGGEARVVSWSIVALLVQAGAAAALIPALGATGAAIGLTLGEALIWAPLRRPLRQPPAAALQLERAASV